LEHAAGHGFQAVLSAPCDLLGIPPDAGARLSPGPAIAENQWLLGVWPVALAGLLRTWLQTQDRYPVHAFAAAADARRVFIPGLLNINRPDDLP
jgi:molybdopterin-guanine dinucleotide biosynthesis protein A